MSAAPPAVPLAEPPCWYAVLGVTPEASAEELKQAWRQAALRAHPDKVARAAAAMSSSSNASCDAHFVLVQQAWEVLQDPERRAAYDRQRAVHAARQQVAINETVEWEEMDPEELAEGQPCHAWPCRCGGAFVLLDGDALAAADASAGQGMARPELLVACSTCSLHISVLLPPGGTLTR